MLTFILLLLSSGANGNSGEHPTITIGTAASLYPALMQIKDLPSSPFKVKLLFGSTANIVRQVANGAKIDAVFSADLRSLEGLFARNLVRQEPLTKILRNKLLFVSSGSTKGRSIAEVVENPRVRKIAVCNTAVPLGHYSKLFAEENKVWEAIKVKAVFPDHARAALQMIRSGAVDAAFIYGTDLKESDRFNIIDSTTTPGGQPIDYPIAVTSNSKLGNQTKQWIHWLSNSREAQKVFLEHGFTMAISAQSNGSHK